MEKPVLNYLVRFRMFSGLWANYTSPKVQLSEEMADALARHLQRNKTASMVVEIPSGEIIKEYAA